MSHRRWLLTAATAMGVCLCASGLASAQVASGPFNVKTFGATGNGVTDDTAAFSATFGAVPVSGGEIYIPAGTYRLTGGMGINNKNVSIRGEGMRNSKLVFYGGSSLGFLFQSTSTTVNYTFAVRSLSILRGCTTPTIVSGKVTGCASNDGVGGNAGIWATWAAPSTRDSFGGTTCTIHDVQVGPEPWPSGAPDIRWANGIYLLNATNAKLSALNIMGDWSLHAGTSAFAGIYIDGNSTGVDITSGDINYFNRGIFANAGSDDIHISDVETISDFGYYLLGSGTALGTSIANSHANSQTRGIYVGDRSDVSLTNNLVFVTLFGAPSAPFTDIVGIEIESNFVPGKRFRVIGNTVAGSVCAHPGTTTEGIVLKAPFGTVTDSVVMANHTGTTSVGIWLQTASVTGVSVVGNLNGLFTIAPYGAASPSNYFADNVNPPLPAGGVCP